MEKTSRWAGLAGFASLVGALGCDDTSDAAERAREADREVREELSAIKEELRGAKEDIQRLGDEAKAKTELASNRAQEDVHDAAAEAKKDLVEHVDHVDKNKIRGDDNNLRRP